MRNGAESKISGIIALAEKLPFFTLADLASVSKDRGYLKVSLSRYKKGGKLIRLKRGLYVSKAYLDKLQKTGRFNLYPELIAGILYSPSYLSLDYVLYQHNLLTEVARNFTCVTRNKTAFFSNGLGNYFYHKIKDDFFCGFTIVKVDNFIIYKATKAKALFDYLYLRKNLPVDRKSVQELRLNMKNFGQKDRKEFNQYLKFEGTQKIARIFKLLQG